MKKVFALLLAVLTIMLAACGTQPPVATPDTATPDMATPDTATPDEPEPTTAPTEPTTLANDRFDPEQSADLIGSWTTTITLDGSMFNLEMEDKVEMTLVYRLNGDGTYFRGVEPEEYQTAIATYGAAVEKFMLDRLCAKFTAEKVQEGISKKKIETLWEKEKAAAEEQAKRFVEGLYLEYRFSQLNGEGDYYAENSIFWFSKADGSYEPCGYELTDAGLTITEVENPRVYRQLKLELPLLLTKAQ